MSPKNVAMADQITVDHLSRCMCVAAIMLRWGRAAYVTLPAVIANSTLFWWSAWLKKHPSKRVAAPARWLA